METKESVLPLSDMPLTNVTVMDLKGNILLQNGQGSTSPLGVVSCGQFDENRLPVVGDTYIVEQQPAICGQSGITSTFKVFID